MACPMGYGVRFKGGYEVEDESEINQAQEGVNRAVFSDHQVSYSQYLGLDKLLSCQQLRSSDADQLVPDEHLFIIIHQAYELWFKQIIYDVDHVRTLLDNKIVDETKTLKIVSLLERTVRILKLLVDQMLVLETMSPLDFVEFRKYLASASGFQSLQFRLLENKLGVATEHRVRYNAQHYREAFSETEDRERIRRSEIEPSLFVLIERWLARTPGIYEEDVIVENGDHSIFASECEFLTNDSAKSAILRSDSVADALGAGGAAAAASRTSCLNASLYDGSRATPPPGLPSGPADELTRKKSAAGPSVGLLAGSAGPAADEESPPTAKERNVSGATDDETSQTAIKRKNFWNRYLEAVDKYLLDMKVMAKNDDLPAAERKIIQEDYVKTKRSFQTITDEQQHQALIEKGERRLSHNALKGALMIYFYRDMPRFSQPYQILTFLMDIDSLLQKWRYNHVMLVQRMLGSKAGTGGSSGYLYLRTTVSDRYKVFLDLFNLSTWLIPRVYIPKLSPKMFKTLSEHASLNNNSHNNSCCFFDSRNDNIHTI